jgi:hyperosmotically inducible protein
MEDPFSGLKLEAPKKNRGGHKGPPRRKETNNFFTRLECTNRKSKNVQTDFWREPYYSNNCFNKRQLRGRKNIFNFQYWGLTTHPESGPFGVQSGVLEIRRSRTIHSVRVFRGTRSALTQGMTKHFVGYATQAVAIATLSLSLACSTASKAPDVQGPISDAIKQSGIKNVSVDQDRDKGVVTLKGSVASEAEKIQAGSVAKSIAGNQVVGNEIAVLPAGQESVAKSVNSDLDEAIEKNLSAALLQARLKDYVKYDVKTGVVTLTGDVNTQADRAEAQRIASGIPNVQQVVNKIDVKNQKASSSR